MATLDTRPSEEIIKELEGCNPEEKEPEEEE